MALAERRDTAGAGTDLTSLPTARVLPLVKSGGDDTAAAWRPSDAAIDVSCRRDIEGSRRTDARQACHRAHTPCQRRRVAYGADGWRWHRGADVYRDLEAGWQN